MNEASAVVENGTPAAPAKRALSEDDQKKLATQVQQYMQVSVNIKKVEKAREILTTQRNAAVKAIYDEFGKGPHPTPEGDQIIINRGDTYFFKTAYNKKGAEAG